MKKDENGYIVVETVFSFTMLVLLMASILTLINVVTVQARMHYALTQTAQTVSMYCYALDKIGFASPLMGISDDADESRKNGDKFKDNVDEVFSALDSIGSTKGFDDLYDPLNDMYEAGKGIYDQSSQLMKKDPKELFTDFLKLSVDQLESVGFQLLLRNLMDRYLSNGGLSGDEYLVRYGVEEGTNGLNFAPSNFLAWSNRGNGNSRLLTGDGSVRIIVRYELDYMFGALPLPFTKLVVAQQAETKAWLNGHGEGYSK